MKIKLLLIVSLSFSALQADLLLTGKIVAGQSQNFITPWSNNWSIQLEWMRDEGDLVEKGELVVVYDTANLESEIEQQEASLRSSKEKAREKILKLEQDIIDAEHDYTQAGIKHKMAILESEIPDNFRSEYEHESAQFDKIKTAKELEKAQVKLQSKKKEMTAEISRQKLEVNRIEAVLQKKETDLAKLHLYAEQSGPVLHAMNPWDGNKITAGQSVRTMWKVASIAGDKNMAVKAWVNEVDWPRIQQNKTVSLMADAFPGNFFTGTISKVSQQAEKKQEWGDASYYDVDIDINTPPKMKLIPGMSIQIRISDQQSQQVASIKSSQGK